MHTLYNNETSTCLHTRKIRRSNWRRIVWLHVPIKKQTSVVGTAAAVAIFRSKALICSVFNGNRFTRCLFVLRANDPVEIKCIRTALPFFVCSITGGGCIRRPSFNEMRPFPGLDNRLMIRECAYPFFLYGCIERSANNADSLN